MDRNQDEIIKQTKREERQTFINKFVKDVNSTLANELTAVFLIPDAEENGVLFSRYGKGRDTSESMSHLVQSEDYIIADPAVIDGTKSAEQGTYYMYSKYTNTTNVSPMPEHKAVKVSFDKVLDFINDDNNSIKKPDKPKLGFWGTLRNAFSFVFGKPEKQKTYERQIDVYKAQKFDILEKNFGFKVPEYDKNLLNKSAAFVYVQNGKSFSPEKAEAIVAKANEKAKSKMLIDVLKKSGDRYVKLGAEYIDNALVSGDAELKNVNASIVNYVNTAGITEDVVKNLSKLCSKVGMEKEQLDLGYIDDEKMKASYLGIAENFDGFKKVGSVKAEEVKADVPEQKNVEKPTGIFAREDAAEIRRTYRKDAEELINNEPEAAEPEAKPEIKEKKAPLKAEELMKKAAEDTIKIFLGHEDPEVANGAKAIDSYMKNNPESDTTKLLGDYLAKGGKYVRGGDFSSKQAQSFVGIFESTCTRINELFGDDPESMPDMIKNMHIKGTVSEFVPDNIDELLNKDVPGFNK